MIGLVVTGHGHFADGIHTSAQMIAGENDYVRYINFEEGMTPEQLAEKFNAAVSPSVRRSRSWSIWGCWTAARRRHLCEEHLRAEPGQQDEFSFDATADTIRDLLELRIVLETFAAYHAAQRRTDEGIASIQKLLRDMREAKKGQRRHRGVGAEPAQALPRLPPGPGQGRPQRRALQRLRVPL